MSTRRRRNRNGKTSIKTVYRQNQIRKMKLGMILLVLLFCMLAGMKLFGLGPFSDAYMELQSADVDASKPDMEVALLEPNPYSRPQTKTERITGIVIHYTANPGATAMQNRNYFNGLKDSHITQASSHFIVGLDGEIVQCIPTWEVAYASNNRNKDTVSIECCHPDKSGKFKQDTYHSMVQLTAWLCKKFGLTEEDVIRHYDVTGKNCPKYFVEEETAWHQFRQDVKRALEK